MASDLDKVVAQVEALEASCSRGEVSPGEFQRQATALWGEWLSGGAPEARILAQVLGSLGGPDAHQQVQQIWAKWLSEIREEEGL